MALLSRDAAKARTASPKWSAMYAFLGQGSALEALRFLTSSYSTLPRWPQAPRPLPRRYELLTTQRMFDTYASENDLASFGVTTQPVHFLVNDARKRSRGKKAAFNVWKRDVPPFALLRLSETLFSSTPEFVLLQMATHHKRQMAIIEESGEEFRRARETHALVDPDGPIVVDDPFAWELKRRIVLMAMTFMEFAGTYRLPVAGNPTTYRQPPLTSKELVLGMLATTPRLYGGERLRKALDFSFERSASPMETALSLMLTLPIDYGGFCLPRPELNAELPTREFSALWSGGDVITPDMLWRSANLVIEYDSDEQHASRGERKAAQDATRANVLSAMGYTVLRATTGNVTSLQEMERLARQVATHLGIAAQTPDEVTLIRRSKLHQLLMWQ